MIVLMLYKGELSPTEDRMQVAMEELSDLKGVWSELSKIWEQVDDLKEKPWLSVQPRKVRQHLVIVYECLSNNNITLKAKSWVDV